MYINYYFIILEFYVIPKLHLYHLSHSKSDIKQLIAVNQHCTILRSKAYFLHLDYSASL